MSIISKNEVEKLYGLARLPLDGSELAETQKDLEEILGYVAKLSEIDLKAVAPVPGGTDMVNRLRADALDPSAEALTAALRESFPTEEAQMAKVPSVFGK
jgi:aspartyl/glutamyl-tRNA(Asn/Gln) amidotransferase C subunit